MATIRDVAKRAGVSVATVSAVINDSRPVSAHTRSRVEQAIKELNYRPNYMARALSTKQSRTIAGIVPSIANPFFPQIFKSVEDVAFRNSFSVVMCNTEGNPERVMRYQKMLLEQRVAGLLITMTWDLTRPEVIGPFIEADIPVVGLAGSRSADQIDIVMPDDLWGARQATDYLLQMGHRRIAYLGVTESHTTKLRLEGFREAHRRAQVPLVEELVMLGHDFKEDEGYTLTKQLLSEGRDFTAIFAYNDVLAQGALAALAEEDIDVPSQVSVIGYDDTLASYSRPKLTSVSVPKEQMGRLAAEILIKRIGGRTGERQRVLLRPDLVVRESVGPVPSSSTP